MSNHQWTPPAVTQADIDPAEGWAEAMRTEPSRRAARVILAVALAVGGIGTGAAVASGHGASHHAHLRHAAHKASDPGPGGSAYLARSGYAICNPWVY